MTELEEEELALDKSLAKLIEEKSFLQAAHKRDQDLTLSQATHKHFNYVLPLMREIYLLELKIKEQTKIYEEKKWKCETAAHGKDLLTASLKEEECVLKGWFNKLQSTSDNVSVTNKTYKAEHEEGVLKERLCFTVLSNSVHVGVQIFAETQCHSIRFVQPSSIRLVVKSDTHVPGLEQLARSVLDGTASAPDLISLVATYIQEDMAPYVIIIPAKKKGKSTKVKSKVNSQTNRGENLSASENKHGKAIAENSGNT